MTLISISELSGISILGNLVENSRMPSPGNNLGRITWDVWLRPIKLPIQEVASTKQQPFLN